MNRMPSCLLTLVLILLAVTGHAQTIDGSAYFSPITDNVQPLIHGNMFSKSYLERRGKNARTPRQRANAPAMGIGIKGGATVDLSIHFDPSVSARIRKDYITSVGRATSKETADSLDAYYRAHDARALLGKAMAPYGLRNDDFSDIITAYFVVMWMTANDAVLPLPEHVRGVQAQMREVLLENGSVPPRNGERQRLAEALIYQTVTLLQVRETAQAQRNGPYLEQLASSAQESMAAQGFDLRALLLTEYGMVPR